MAREPGNFVARQVRLYVGVTLLTLSFVCPLFGILIAQLDLPIGLKATIIGLLSLGIPEVLIIAAAATLGKENYEIIKARCIGYLKHLVPSAKVGRLRYNIGLIMFILPLIPAYVQAYIPRWLPDDSAERLYVNLAADIMFIASLFVLGGDFWDKLRALFSFEAKAQFPESISGDHTHPKN